MTIIQVVVALILVGVLLWLVNNYIPMAGAIKSLVNLIVVIAAVVWVLQVFGIWDNLVALIPWDRPARVSVDSP